MSDLVTLKIEQGALTTIPLPEFRGEFNNGYRHWFATLTETPTGFSQEVWPTGRGRFFYRVPDFLQKFSVCIYGADRIMRVMTHDDLAATAAAAVVPREYRRWYGVLLLRDAQRLVFVQELSMPGAHKADHPHGKESLDKRTLVFELAALLRQHEEDKASKQSNSVSTIDRGFRL